ncbi:MAG: hypothetical protein ACYTEL_26560 [Planctomycetota bacterium]
MQCRYYIGAVMIGGLLISALCFAVVSTEGEGRWPDSWPKELEPLRKQAKTVRVGHGIQETVYVIGFRNREAFEKAWPHILKVKSPSAPLILENSPFKYHVSGTESVTGVMILAPCSGFGGGRYSPDAETYEDVDELVKEGKVPRASAWLLEILSGKSELAEYVTAVRTEDGKKRWVDVRQLDEEAIGFRNRARIDIILITDGEIVDLNRIPLPAETPIIDNRFKQQHNHSTAADG